jgi:hypothetical protein
MNFDAGDSKSTTNNVRELTETELRVVAGGWTGLGGLALQRAVEIYVEQQRIEALYQDRK